MLRAQSSIEFLYCTGLAILIFTMVAIIFYESQVESNALSAYVESQRICHEIAAQVSVIATAENGTQALLLRPQALSSQNYTVLVSGQNRAIVVQYEQRGTTCMLATTSVSNGTNSTFYITGDVLVRNDGRGVVFG